MSLRPRYSLLTLLVLTALVAGGVKLWRGPHRAVEQASPYTEDEYTYTCDWSGRKTVRGPWVMRYKQLRGTPEQVQLLYYRQGEKLNCKLYIVLDAAAKTYSPAAVAEGEEPTELTALERAELDQAMERESQRLQALGYKLAQSDAKN
jgi:hypothetical protein